MKNNIYLLLLISILHVNVNAQTQSTLDRALRFIESQQKNWNLESSDISDLLVSDRYKDEYNGIEHFYFQQSYKGIPIYNAITSVHLDGKGNVYESPSRFIPQLSAKANSNKARLSAKDALKASLIYYKVENALLPNKISRSMENKEIFEKTNFTHSDIPVHLTYFLTKENKLKLAWDLSLDLVDRNDYWSVRVDANTGQILDELNLTVKCNFNHPHNVVCEKSSVSRVVKTHFTPVTEQLTKNNNLPTAAPLYNVIAFPTESPLHGSRTFVSNPADPIASKFGWHTTKNDGSPEYSSTRGNNVFAYLDTNADNSPDFEIADGGNGMIFDFPFDQKTEPIDYRKAALTNLFYVCNKVHDVTYGFGFNEAAGNFQVNTYGKGGKADYVAAEAQDGSGVNNANFSTPADGTNGRMQMYLWTAAASEVNITAPPTLVGNISASRGAFGPAPDTTPITAKVVWSDDGSGEARLGCINAQKPTKILGNIVLIERGVCEFGTKAFNAQNAGAVAVIICGFDDQGVSMAAGNDGGKVTIPTYYITKSTCDKLKSAVDSGKLVITIVKPIDSTAGPDSLDGDFDNGIISHEYGHGISNRLTGGPSNSNCLGNVDNMGEGWSDFMSLIMTAKVGDKPTDKRGVGNYAVSGPIDGTGIRRRPYTTDMNINEFTYTNINAETHDLGEVWTAMLWDLYWAMSAKYGFDPNFSNKNSGNNKAIQLVMDGMKLQPCMPGFVDGRNAILQADKVDYNGENQCLIWEVFARRGLGFEAKQGNTNFVGDESEDKNTYPICANTTSVSKTATPLVKAGTEITYTLIIKNLRAQKISNINILDYIPIGCTYVNGSASLTPTMVNANSIHWNLASMDSVESKTITYRLKTDAGKFSNTLWIDDFESNKTEDNWVVNLNKGNIFWIFNELVGVDDSHAWQVQADDLAASDASLENANEIKVDNSEVALLFQHKFNTQGNIDGGFLQISDNNGQSYSLINPADFSINGYTGNIDYSAIAIPKNKGFTGYTANFIPTVLDLNAYRGKNIKLKFRFGNDASIVPTNADYKGWTIDNLEIINPVYYNSEVCVTTSLGENICTSVAGKGTLVDSKKVAAVNNTTSIALMSIQPNPASNKFRINLNEEAHFIQLKLTNLNGQLLKVIDLSGKSGSLEINTLDLPKGIILVQAISKDKIITQKLIIK
ncbi:MAG: M36 family metallopeptidase [Saprospiraceae bacterium]